LAPNRGMREVSRSNQALEYARIAGSDDRT
jgi:hypothetical protein